ncbi:MAG: o-succinylbenzoate--CoA ligase [Chloroflexi bacterium]|nr:o-succinylbenzoate--CoA ligase [Chloroflexota bacterium]
MSFPDWLAERARLSPERTALIVGDARWTFRELDAQVTQLAQSLHAQGVQRGARVAVLMHNGAPFVFCVHALARLGAILVPINTRLTPHEIHWQLENVRARFLLCSDQLSVISDQLSVISDQLSVISDQLSVISDQSLVLRPQSSVLNPQPSVLRPQSSVLRPQSSVLNPPSSVLNPPSSVLNPQSSVLSPPSSISPLSFELDVPHSILYTSGTSGQPKGAVLTYGNHWWSAIASALNLGLREDDCWLACLPLFHVGGLAILLRGVIYGMTVLVHESFDAAAVNRAIDREGVTMLSVVSTMLQRMFEARGDEPYPASLRGVLVGGGPAPRTLLEEAQRRGAPVVQTYGLTEAASQVATLALQDALRKIGSAGKPLFGTELRIENDGIEMEHGQAGEIVIRGPTVMAGYVDQPEETARVLHDGWLHTGDVGYVDADGYLYVLDRRDDLFISGGENVYPAEIEAALRTHPAVLDAGVIGAPDARWGRVPVAFVQIEKEAPVTADDLMQHCTARLARYKIPTRIHFVAALPRNAAGKLLRRALRP